MEYKKGAMKDLAAQLMKIGDDAQQKVVFQRLREVEFLVNDDAKLSESQAIKLSHLTLRMLLVARGTKQDQLDINMLALATFINTCR